MNKSDAEAEALKLSRALPLQDRSDVGQAIAFAALIAKDLSFETVGQHDKIVQAWLVRDLQRSTAAATGVNRAKTGVSASTGERQPRQRRGLRPLLSFRLRPSTMHIIAVKRP